MFTTVSKIYFQLGQSRTIISEKLCLPLKRYLFTLATSSPGVHLLRTYKVFILLLYFPYYFFE